MLKYPPTNAGDAGSIPGSGICTGVGNDNLFQYSCQKNPMDRGAWRATVHRVPKSRTRLSGRTQPPKPEGLDEKMASDLTSV